MSFWHPKVKVVKEKERKEERITKRDVREKSILIMGSIGVGKTLIANSLHETTGLPVVDFELLKQCPKNPTMLLARIATLEYYIDKFVAQTKGKTPNDDPGLFKRIDNLVKEEKKCEAQIELRKILPRVTNYENLGYNPNMASILRSKFGELTWHLYEKQYETEVLEDVLRTAKIPIILDMSASTPISLVEPYAGVIQDLFRRPFISSNCNLRKISFGLIEKVIEPYSNVIYLKVNSSPQLPKSHLSFNEKLLRADFQYERLATMTLEVDGLRTGDRSYNAAQLDATTDFVTTEWKRNNGGFKLPSGQEQKLLP